MIDINEALTVYLGTDDSGGYSPVGHEDRLKERYGDAWPEVLTVIEEYLQFDYHPDWSKQDLNNAGAEFSEAVSIRYPDLATNVVRALGNRFAYGWR
jgi:hypothetical protein